jgi:hypothetical protein
VPEYFAGLDLGQSADYTALAIAEQGKMPRPDGMTERHVVGHETRQTLIGETVWAGPIYGERPVLLNTYGFRHLQRFPLRTSYPAIVDQLKALLSRPPLAGNVTLAVDATGVGPPVVDMLRRAELPCRLRAITITGGNEVVPHPGGYGVPKRDLVSITQVLLQDGRLKVAPSLPEADTLVRELQTFQYKITLAANDTYGAWREGTHDDLLLAVCLACWIAEYKKRLRAF